MASFCSTSMPQRRFGYTIKMNRLLFDRTKTQFCLHFLLLLFVSKSIWLAFMQIDSVNMLPQSKWFTMIKWIWGVLGEKCRIDFSTLSIKCKTSNGKSSYNFDGMIFLACVGQQTALWRDCVGILCLLSEIAQIQIQYLYLKYTLFVWFNPFSALQSQQKSNPICK